MGERRAAAIFDLDRTLLNDGSGLLLAEALAEVGLISDTDRRIAELSGGIYRWLGETWVGMQITRRSIGRIRGWAADDLREAARRSVDKMEDAVFEEAKRLVERHRSEGLVICVATSTGRDIVEPVCDRLGVDHLIATDYEVQEGVLTGGFIGEWLWGPDKAEAVRDFAEGADIDLSRSFAYSDSYFDRPMLELVGFPRAVNPDPVLRALAVRRGWPVLEFRDRDEVPGRGLEPYDLIRPFAHPLLSPVSIRVEGLESIPTSGAVVIAGNHRSYLDPVVMAGIASRRGRKLRYLGKKEVFDAPLMGDLARALGQIRVERGTGASRPLDEAIDAIARGEAVGIFPQGTIPRGRAFFEPRLRGKTGVARLGAWTGVPVVPVAMWGAERIWPRSSRLPKLTELVMRTPVHARVGEPMHLKAPEGREEDADVLAELTQEVMDRISEMLPPDVRDPGDPTPEQIRWATPANMSVENLEPHER